MRDAIVVAAAALLVLPAASGLAPASPSGEPAAPAATPASLPSAIAVSDLLTAADIRFDLPSRAMVTSATDTSEATAVPTPGSGLLLLLGATMSMRRVAFGRRNRSGDPRPAGARPAVA